MGGLKIFRVHKFGLWLACGIFANGLHAAEITYVGKEVGDAASSYVVQNWSLTSVGKQFNTKASERYGTAGYYQIRPTATNVPVNTFESAPGGNDLGINASTNPTLVSVPSFISSITGSAGNFVNLGGYATYRANDGSTIYRQGALSVPVGNGPNNSPAGDNASYFGTALQFTLGADAKFRIGVAVDSVADGAYAPNYVGIYNSNTGTVFSTALTRDGNPDMVFFDITGNAGDSFVVALWQNVETPHVAAAFSLVTFDYQAARATYIGKETGDASPSSVVRNWSLPSVAKQFDTKNSGRYGAAGYYQIRPTPDASPQNVFETGGGGNDLGINATANPTLYLAPSFISSITGSAGNFVNFGGYATYQANDGSTMYRQGGLSVSVNQGPFSGRYFGHALEFTLGAFTKFRIGLAVDSVGDSQYAPDFVGLYNNDTGTVLSAALTRDGNPDMVFFDVEGNAGDSFTVALWQNDGTQNKAALSLVTFDVNQAPTDLVLSSSVISENNLVNDVVGTFTTTDADTGDLHTYSLVPGAVDNASFLITGNSLLANEVFDFEAKASYTIRVRSVDTAGALIEKEVVVSISHQTETILDTTPPVITLNDPASVTVAWGSSYSDAGASVEDDVDAPRTISGVGSVDTSRPGTYSITFDATDAAGNAATQVVRTVIVSPPSNSPGADGLSGVLRYAFGGQGPNDPVAKPILTQSNGSLVLTAIVRTNDPNLEVVGQWVTNLASYPTLSAGSNEVTGVPAVDTSNVPAGCQRQVFAVSPGSDGKKFLRLKTTLNP